MKKILLILISLTFIFIPVHSQNNKEKKTYHIKCCINPVYSLARFDTNIDNNLLELRAFIVLKENDKDGKLIKDAIVMLENQQFKFEKDYYQIKVKIPQIQKETNLKIKIKGEIILDKNFYIPNWIKLTSPKPNLIDPQEEITITWSQSYLKIPANIKIYDFKSGRTLFTKNMIMEKQIKIKPNLLKGTEIVRILVTDMWHLTSHINDENNLNKDSEIIFQSWSQNFLRIKKIDPIKKYIQDNKAKDKSSNKQGNEQKKK